MRTTTDVTHGGPRDPAPHATAITAAILKQRDCLPHTLNGRPMSPSTVAAANIRREMQQGRSAEVKRLLTVLACDLEDGVPLATVLSTLDQMAAYLRLVAGDQAPEPRDLTVLVRNETRAQGRLDLAQLRLLETPTSEAALSEVIEAKNDYHTKLDALMQNVQERWAFLRGTRAEPTIRVQR